MRHEFECLNDFGPVVGEARFLKDVRYEVKVLQSRR